MKRIFIFLTILVFIFSCRAKNKHNEPMELNKKTTVQKKITVEEIFKTIDKKDLITFNEIKETIPIDLYNQWKHKEYERNNYEEIDNFFIEHEKIKIISQSEFVEYIINEKDFKKKI